MVSCVWICAIIYWIAINTRRPHSGEKLFCEYDQEVKHYPEKRGIQTNIGNLNREICRRLPKADEAKGSPQQRD